MNWCRDCKYCHRAFLWLDVSRCHHPSAIREIDYVKGKISYWSCNAHRRTDCKNEGVFFEPKGKK